MSENKQNNDPLTSLLVLFASVKLAVVVLILLAVTSVIGTLIPQNADPSAYVRAYGEFAYRVLSVFDIFNMYYSWWFQALIGIMIINVTVCTIKRWPAIWKIVSANELKGGSLAKKKALSDYSDPRSPQELEAIYKKHLSKKYRRFRVDPDGDGYRLMAEKGRWTRFGVPAVHLSIVVILAGALIGSFFGFDGFVNIAEGDSTTFIRLRNSSDTLSLGFEVRCDDFNVSFYDSGSPKEFRSSLAILENGQTVIEKKIIVNDPLRYKGINFFQSSYGPMPPKAIHIRLTKAADGGKVTHKLAMGQSVNLPEGAGKFTLQKFSRDFKFRGRRVGEAVLGVLDKPDKDPVQIALPLRFPSFDKMRKGEWIISVDGYEDAYYTGLQVTKDPGVPLVYAGFGLLIIGCWVAFFMSHHKILVAVQPSTNSSRVKIYGTTNRHRIGFELKVRRLGETLSAMSSTNSMDDIASTQSTLRKVS
jgi:cytochrome c biogenesis protein